jgi:hypothetical protein
MELLQMLEHWSHRGHREEQSMNNMKAGKNLSQSVNVGAVAALYPPRYMAGDRPLHLRTTDE